MNKANLSLVLAVVAIVIALGGYMYPNSTPALGGTTNYDAIQTSKITVGSSGTGIGTVLASTCNLVGMDVSQTSSTTRPYDCAVTGATAASIVLGSLATSSTFLTGSQTWGVDYVKASSTAGFITFGVHNYGATAVPSATAVGSSTEYLVFVPLATTPGL